MPSERAPYAVTHLDAVDRVGDESGDWRPLRRALEVTAFGLAAFTGARAGDEVIEPHDERSPNAGAHEEVYLVVAGAARFELGGERIEAPAGTLVRVDVGTHRVAWATAPATTVLVIGGLPGAALPVSPFEHWYAAQGAADAGDAAGAADLVAAGLADHPQNAGLRFHLARFLAQGGDRAGAAERLAEAVALDPALAARAAAEPALAGLTRRRPASGDGLS